MSIIQEQVKVESQFAQTKGLEVALTVRHYIGEDKASYAPETPAEKERYKAVLTDIVKTCKPAILSVEHKETSKTFYDSPPEKYAHQLKNAVKIAHAGGSKCANGGLASDYLTLMTFYHYLERNERERADDFAERAFTPHKRRIVYSAQAANILDDMLKEAWEFVEIYKNIGVDYVNIHWSVEDARALHEAVDFLQRDIKVPFITTEIQKPRDPRKTKELMKAVTNLKFPCAVWYVPVEGPQALTIADEVGQLRNPFLSFQGFIKRKFLSKARVQSKK